MVPLRFVSEQLGATVDWDNDSFTAILTSPGRVRDAGALSGTVSHALAHAFALAGAPARPQRRRPGLHHRSLL